MIIDTHSQLWTAEALKTFPEKWLAGYRAMFGDKLSPSIENTLKDMEEAGVDKSVFCRAPKGTESHLERAR